MKAGFLPKSTGKGKSQSLAAEDTKKDIGPIYSLDNFIVNLVGDRGKNYLKTQLALEMDNLKTKEEIDKQLPKFRDSILTLLSSKSNDDIKSMEGKFQLRAEIISMLNQHLRLGKIVNVYFTEFIVQ
ncbi:MAG: flagellar basal body-associated FliL family protein [Deltaproteobacteria bacterium]|nr:flagellar basal body-associated FliL family protein [Deltaproteobacteria bacterium]